MTRPWRTLTPEQLASGECWTCVVCSQRWLAKEMRFQDGIESDRRCPNCYEPNGGSLARKLDRAAASERAAAITAEYAPPPRFPGWFDETELPALVSFSAEPLRLTRGGSSAALTITGTNLATGDTITYGHAGITNAVAAALTPVTYDSDGNTVAPHVDTLVLTVQASVAVPVGLYDLTYAGQIYRNRFDVRN